MNIKVSKKKIPVIVFWILCLYVILSSIIITEANEYKLIRQFGKVQRVENNPGISFKIPFIETVNTIPKEILLYDQPVSDVITSDKKSMIIDSYVLWRVTENRIDTIVYNAVKTTISNMTQDEVIKSRDGKITVTVTEEETGSNDLILAEKEEVVEIKSLSEEIMEHIGSVYEQYGILIMNVEVKRLDLPDDNKQAVYTRMISERENIAAQYTAEGKSEAQMIQNTTDKEVSIMQSQAKAKGEQLKAEGEGEYMRILADAYSDETRSDFYSFVRALDAAKVSMAGEDKTLILPADSPIAKIFM